MPNPTVPSFQNPDAYEQVMGRWSRRLAPLLIRFGGLSDDDPVLDVGCGTGSLVNSFDRAFSMLVLQFIPVAAHACPRGS